MLGPLKSFNRVSLVLFFTYFVLASAFSIYRYRNFYTLHFDMTTMHQPTYNSYMAIKTGDYSRVLEMTDPHENRGQVNRLSFHSDIILILVSLLYFIYEGPETLLVLQAFLLALAVFPLREIVLLVFKANAHKQAFATLVGFIYLLYFALMLSLLNSFHPVSFAPALILYMVYFALCDRYLLSILFYFLSLSLKENVALSTLFFGFSYAIYVYMFKLGFTRKRFLYVMLIVVFSAFWFYFAMGVLIPHFRGDHSYYLNYFSTYGNSPGSILKTLATSPTLVFKTLLSNKSITYFLATLTPLFLVPVLSPFFLAALPEYLVNILSGNVKMTSLQYQYELILIPYLFVSLTFGLRFVFSYVSTKLQYRILAAILVFCFFSTMFFSGLIGNSEVKSRYRHVDKGLHADIKFWSDALDSDEIKVATTNYLSPHFASRRYLYLLPLSEQYEDADFVVILETDIIGSDRGKEFYEDLRNNSKYRLVYSVENFKVYKKV